MKGTLGWIYTFKDGQQVTISMSIEEILRPRTGEVASVVSFPVEGNKTATVTLYK